MPKLYSLAQFFSEEMAPACGGPEYHAFCRRRNTRALLYAFSSGILDCDPELGIILKDGKPIWTDGGTYRRFYFSVSGTRFSAFVHKAVWLYVHGTIAEGEEIDHLNTDTQDNRISNLQSVTKLENLRRMHEHRERVYQAEMANSF